MQDRVLGIHFLNTPLEGLSNLTRLPDTLEDLNLVYARMALLFALGHEQDLRDEGNIPSSEDQNAVQAFFERWQDQRVAEDLSCQPILVDGTTSHFQSIILGTELVVEAPNNLISFGIAESLLGTLEAFLATSHERDSLPYREHVKIIVAISEQLDNAAQLHFLNDDSGILKIQHPAHLQFSSKSEQSDFIESLQTILMEITGQMLHMRDLSAWSERVTGQEHALARALIFGDTLTLDRNVFGEEFPLCIKDWLRTDAQNYVNNREKIWREKESRDSSSPTQFPRFGDGSPPKELTDDAQLKHTDRRVLSPIDIPLWDQAEWRGTVFAQYAGGLPILAIMFKDAQAGQEIFHGWQERWGAEDEENMVRVAIITKLSKKQPSNYAVIVGANPNTLIDGKKVQMLVSRVHRMAPENLTNLENFLTEYKKVNAFLFAPAEMDPKEPKLFMQCAIKKCQIDVREAWQISENDPDLCALRSDDEPIIPPEVETPPVQAALMRLQSWKDTQN